MIRRGVFWPIRQEVAKGLNFGTDSFAAELLDVTRILQALNL